MKNIDLLDVISHRRTFGFLDDFEWYISPHRWTSLAADAGATVAISASEECGKILLTSGAVDNNECGTATTNKPFKFAVDKPLLYETRIQYAEAATNAMNACVGFSSVMNTADMLLDNGAGPAASFSGAIIYKLDGATVWRFRTSIGATNTDTASQHTAGGAAYQVLRIEVREAGGTMEATPWLNDAQMLDANGRPIKHSFLPTSAAAMQAGIYIKAGSGSSETLLCDYIAPFALR